MIKIFIDNLLGKILHIDYIQVSMLTLSPWWLVILHWWCLVAHIIKICSRYSTTMFGWGSTCCRLYIVFCKCVQLRIKLMSLVLFPFPLFLPIGQLSSVFSSFLFAPSSSQFHHLLLSISQFCKGGW
jgi:hypothetical protein